jgi:hypothetical protein
MRTSPATVLRANVLPAVFTALAGIVVTYRDKGLPRRSRVRVNVMRLPQRSPDGFRFGSSGPLPAASGTREAGSSAIHV